MNFARDRCALLLAHRLQVCGQSLQALGTFKLIFCGQFAFGNFLVCDHQPKRIITREATQFNGKPTSRFRGKAFVLSREILTPACGKFPDCSSHLEGDGARSA